MASTAIKVSALERLQTLSGSEEILVAYLGKNFKIQLADLAASVSMPTKVSLGLDQVDNTSDLNKPISLTTQAALDGKSDVSHTHSVSSIVGLAELLAGKAELIHGHTVSDIEGLSELLDQKANLVHGHTIDQIQGLPDALNNKVDQAVYAAEIQALSNQLGNTVTTEQLTQIVETLAPLVHRHDASDIDNLPEPTVTFTASEW